MRRIATVRAREILDSRGTPTVEVDLRLDDGSAGRAAVPSGRSKGAGEAVELRDGDSTRYAGKGVRRAVENVNESIAAALRGFEVESQAVLDRRLIDLDGTERKEKLGANALLGVSLAVARAVAASEEIPLYRHLGGEGARILPVPMLNVLNGGSHADNGVDFEEFMIAPAGATSFAEALRMGAACYEALRDLLKKAGRSTAIGDEGGFAPELRSNLEAVELIHRSIERAGLRAGVDVALALDAAATGIYNGGVYEFAGQRRSAAEMVEFWEEWVTDYPLWSIEDGLAEQDWSGWELLTARLHAACQLVGDDLFATNARLIRAGVERRVANAVIIKLNQIGTLSEALAAVAEARAAGYGVVISHRSGETADDFISDLAVATGAGQIKGGAPCRGERTAKYNQLLRIEEELGCDALYAGKHPFVAAWTRQR